MMNPLLFSLLLLTLFHIDHISPLILPSDTSNPPKLNVALVLCGEFRTFLFAYKAYSTFFLHEPQNSAHRIDVFGSTYETTQKSDKRPSAFATLSLNVMKKWIPEGQLLITPYPSAEELEKYVKDGGQEFASLIPTLSNRYFTSNIIISQFPLLFILAKERQKVEN